ncbi:hypothetical protein THRCLA_07200 [Thraustotheca clavata]|uniref:Aminoglycoside phosphotransferase domain-containing protein n=1 Tax=Thraustotheca clavata TaxID=74557 RepID=A0A1V9ZFB7_9STRA|nr:hypothetical protein THRCLA_07200 [Thraustotheca clavata]
MPLFEQTIPIDKLTVAALVLKNWGIELDDIIKASQNHTFRAHDAQGARYSVRVTPDPSGKHLNRIKDELVFVNYVASAGLQHVCAPVAFQDQQFVLATDSLVIVVFHWAKGAPVNFMSWRWMLDKAFVIAWGSFFGHLHVLSKKFTQDHPQVAHRIQRYDVIHDGVLAGVPLHEDDVRGENDATQFGVIHGDLNCSNFYYVDGDTPMLSVFDWDQTMRSWYLYDLAQAIFGPIMLAEAGIPIIGTPVPQANPTQYQAWLVAGYEAVSGPLTSAENVQLTRMVSLKRTFYERFCRRALEEGDIPADMEAFIKYIVAWFDNNKE